MSPEPPLATVESFLVTPHQPDPERIVAGLADGRWAGPDPDRRQAAAVVQQALTHLGSKEHWKPAAGGWLVQDTQPQGPYLVVRIDEDGTIVRFDRGSFSYGTQRSLGAALSALERALANRPIVDASQGIVKLTLVNGAELSVKWIVSMADDLNEGQAHVTPGVFEYTGAGWQRAAQSTVDAVVVVSSVVRYDPDEAAADLRALSSWVAGQLGRRLPGPMAT